MKQDERTRVKLHVGIARRAGATATLTLAEWTQTLADFNGLCAYCLTTPYELLEHFIPVEIAGTHVNNCLPACTSCNVRKRNRTGEALHATFGQATIDRLQQYLASRTNQPDEPCIEPRRTHLYIAHQPPTYTMDDPYMPVPQVAKELGWSKVKLDQVTRRLGIQKHTFIFHGYKWIARDDIIRLKEYKPRRGKSPR